VIWKATALSNPTSKSTKNLFGTASMSAKVAAGWHVKRKTFANQSGFTQRRVNKTAAYQIIHKTYFYPFRLSVPAKGDK